MRKLNGTIEELNFQVLQMQEQMRKMQEDNEFRFQELEGKGQARAPAPTRRATPRRQPVEDQAAARRARPVRDDDSGAPPADQRPRRLPTAIPARMARRAGEDLGTITVDKNGNVRAAGTARHSRSTCSRRPGPVRRTARRLRRCPRPTIRRSSTAIPTSSSCRATTRRPRPGFRDHIARFPADPKAADAHYWLGESLLGQQKYRDAAEVFLAANKDYPKPQQGTRHAAEARRFAERAQAARRRLRHLQEIGKRYPEISDALKERVKQEQALAAC